MKQQAIPFWVLIWVFLMAVLSLGLVIVAYSNPGFYGAEWASMGTEKLAGVYGHYTGRNLSMGIVTLIALVWRDVRSLILVLLVLLLRIVTDVADTMHQFLAGTISLDFVVSAIALIGISAVAVVVLHRNGLRAEQKT